MIQTAIGRRYAKALFELLTPAEIGPAKAALRMLAEAHPGHHEVVVDHAERPEPHVLGVVVARER